MSTKRLQPTKGAKKRLREHTRRLIIKIANKAESCALGRGGNEIDENDMEQAVKAVSQKSHSSTLTAKSKSLRKWCMKIAIAMVFSLLLAQLAGFTQLGNVSLELQIVLYSPAVVFLAWLIVFSYIFREEWV